tara:strand:- start:418 stop:699 length:282 start_codon:yes stop_codon:yes gene_type:complete
MEKIKIMEVKNKQARENFLKWYFKSYSKSIIEDMIEELVNEETSNWSFEGLLEIAQNIPNNIANELKYSDYLDDEMRADLEAQDYDVFGEDKI